MRYNDPPGDTAHRGSRQHRRAVGDASITIRPVNRIVALTATLTANRTWTMPLARRVQSGKQITIIDEVGGINANGNDQYVIQIAASGSDAIQNVTGATLNRVFGKITLTSNGTDRWTYDYQDTGRMTDVGSLIADSIRQADDDTPMGYSTGAGGTVTQSSSKSTSVTLNKPVGRITTNNAALAGNDRVAFTFNNSTIAANDVVVVSHKSGGPTNRYLIQAQTIAAGSCEIGITNLTGLSASDAIDINFAVISGAVS